MERRSISPARRPASIREVEKTSWRLKGINTTRFPFRHGRTAQNPPRPRRGIAPDDIIKLDGRSNHEEGGRAMRKLSHHRPEAGGFASWLNARLDWHAQASSTRKLSSSLVVSCMRMYSMITSSVRLPEL